MENNKSRLPAIVADSIVMLARNSLQFQHQLTVQGLVVITPDDKQSVLVSINRRVRAASLSDADTRSGNEPAIPIFVSSPRGSSNRYQSTASVVDKSSQEDEEQQLTLNPVSEKLSPVFESGSRATSTLVSAKSNVSFSKGVNSKGSSSKRGKKRVSFSLTPDQKRVKIDQKRVKVDDEYLKVDDEYLNDEDWDESCIADPSCTSTPDHAKPTVSVEAKHIGGALDLRPILKAAHRKKLLFDPQTKDSLLAPSVSHESFASCLNTEKSEIPSPQLGMNEILISLGYGLQRPIEDDINDIGLNELDWNDEEPQAGQNSATDEVKSAGLGEPQISAGLVEPLTTRSFKIDETQAADVSFVLKIGQETKMFTELISSVKLIANSPGNRPASTKLLTKLVSTQKKPVDSSAVKRQTLASRRNQIIPETIVVTESPEKCMVSDNG